MKIVQAPANVLSNNAKPIKKIDKQILNLIQEMKATLLSARDPEGVGLAAPQVGEALQLFITKPSHKSPIQVFINPLIIADQNAEKETSINQRLPRTERYRGLDQHKSAPSKLEGCLSLQNIWGIVDRKPDVTLSYMDEKGTKHIKKFTGFMATIIQHETDHLNGILFPKRVLEQNQKLYKSYKNKKNEDEFEEIKL